MSLPSQSDIEIPLLLELERAGGRIRKPDDFPAFYERLERHFPGVTSEDKQLRRQSGGKPLVWHNSIEWARNKLRTKRELNGAQRRVWEITSAGKARLKNELVNLGVGNVQLFISSAKSLPEELGARWQPRPLQLHSRAPKRSIRQEPVTLAKEEPAPLEETKSRERDRDLHQQLLEHPQSLTPAQFEHAVCEFLKAKGLKVTHTGRPNDEGIDGEASLPFLKMKVAFQAKRYKSGHNVGIEPVQRLRGSMSGGFDRGIFITTSSYSAAAQGWVEETKAPITLVDGDQLVGEMIALELGVKPITVEAQIDEGFFESLGA